MSYTLPAPPPVTGGTQPLLGPYGIQQAQAEAAYQAAQSQLAAQRGTMLQSFGYTPTANGGMAVDTSNPYGQYQQMLGANQAESQQLQQGMTNRGFQGPGFAGQAEAAGQADAGMRQNQFQTAFQTAEQQQQQAGLDAQSALDNATAENQYNSTQYAIEHGIFDPAAIQLSSQEVQKRVKALQAQWSKFYGGPNSKNKKGETFQQRLNDLSAKLYNPTATYWVGNKKFKAVD